MSSLSGALLESISIAPQFVAFYGVNWSRWCQTLLLEYSKLWWADIIYFLLLLVVTCWNFCSFAWLELVSHRSFMPKLLTVNPPKGWLYVQRLLVDLFKFMEPYLRNAEMAEPVCFFSLLGLIICLLNISENILFAGFSILNCLFQFFYRYFFYIKAL